MSHVDDRRIRPVATPLLVGFGLLWGLLGAGMALMSMGAFRGAATDQLPGWAICWVGYSLVLYFGFVRPHIAIVDGGVRYRGRTVETFVPFASIKAVDTRSPRAVVLRLIDGGEVRAVVTGAAHRAETVGQAIRDGVTAASTMQDDADAQARAEGMTTDAQVRQSDDPTVDSGRQDSAGADDRDHDSNPLRSGDPEGSGDSESAIVPDDQEIPSDDDELSAVDVKPTRRRIHDGGFVVVGVSLTFAGIVLAQVIGG